MEVRTLKLAWLVPALLLAVLPAADAASRRSLSSQASSGHSKRHKHASHKHKHASKKSHGRTRHSAKAKDRTERLGR